MRGVIFDIKRFAVHDGPGIRTTVFFKGCPLRCGWCHNPESQAFGVAVEGRDSTPSVGREVSVDEVLREIERDTAFFDESGGGVTFSGGEPLAQPEFLGALLKRCGEQDLHRCVDTSGYAPRDVILSMAAHTDLFLYDLKLADGERHVQYTGEDNVVIRDNLKALCDTGVAIELRIPIVPGISDAEANVEALAAFVKSLPRPLPVRLLAYHRAAMDKYARVGMAAPLPGTPEPSCEHMEALRDILKPLALEVQA